jgi:hypothetical protein
MEVIDTFVAKLRARGLELTKDGSFTEFLGVKFHDLGGGKLETTQKGLIQKVLETAGMTECNPNGTPTALVSLGADKTGEPISEMWNYRTIVGMLLYLSGNTRPDIAYAVSQVARFSTNPTKLHATAVKMILRYLKGTQEKGTIIRPAKDYKMDLYVDADFCGLFKQEDDRDANSVRSRTGYIIMLCGCPLVWKSQLQTQISQSTLEAEYSALSASLKTFLPVKRIVQEIVSQTRSVDLSDAFIHATVFEDNAGAYFLATNQKITNRTRYFLAKWHWFWEAYNNKEFQIVKCPTDQQRADYLTKALPRASFEANRLAVQGW